MIMIIMIILTMIVLTMILRVILMMAGWTWLLIRIKLHPRHHQLSCHGGLTSSSPTFIHPIQWQWQWQSMMTAIRCLPYLPSRPTWSSSHASKTFSTSSLECTGDYLYSHNFAITRDIDKTVNNYILGNARILKVPSSSIQLMAIYHHRRI